MKKKLSHFDLRDIVSGCDDTIFVLSHMQTQQAKVIALVLLELKTTAERKLIGMVNPKGYSFKIKDVAYYALLACRNELAILPSLLNIGFDRLLTINNKK